MSIQFYELSEGELNAMRQGADIVRVGVGPRPFNASTFPSATRRFPPVVTADATVTFGRMLPESFHDVVSGMLVGDDGPHDNPMLLRRSEWTPEYQAWRDRLRAAGVVLFRPPRWLRLWQRRHEKAKAKRERMRAARYAARWEQAHLRDKPALVDRTERVRRAVGELEALVDAVESSK